MRLMFYLVILSSGSQNAIYLEEKKKKEKEMRNQIIAQVEDPNHWSSWLTLTWLKNGTHDDFAGLMPESFTLRCRKIKKLKNSNNEIAEAGGEWGEVVVVGSCSFKGGRE
ncbi:hypothetical protein Fot_55061 [Forsythia ovata]|uniref:Uncharacterized protein n=1 Tax=Forsythia ovata TaxID=205694 RepID=A0ABD1P668_9LAMI